MSVAASTTSRGIQTDFFFSSVHQSSPPPIDDNLRVKNQLLAKSVYIGEFEISLSPPSNLKNAE